MGGVAKQEYPPLLMLGFWPHTLDEIESRCVLAFPSSITRQRIMDGLRQVVGALNQSGYHLEIWVNGSFLTEKLNPKDSDVAVRFDGVEFDTSPPALQQQFATFIRTDFQDSHQCHLFAFPEYPAGHALYDYGQWRRGYWLNKFGFSRAEEPKGLAVVTTPYVVIP
jgi:hypothetical protein